MFSATTIDDKKTLEEYGYSVNDLPKGSHKKIIVTCDNCHTVIRREFRNSGSVHQCPVVVGDKKKCFKCQQWKDFSLFNKCGKNGSVAKMCRSCYNSHPSVKKCEQRRRNNRKRSLDNDLNLYIRTKASSIKSSCKKRGIPFDIDTLYLLSIWESQVGKCYYSGLDLGRTIPQKEYQCWDAPSIDRVIPSLGYVKGNVRWCCSAVNSFKGTLDDKAFAEIISKIKWWKHDSLI